MAKILTFLREWWAPGFLAAGLVILAVPGIMREDLSPSASGYAMDGLFIRDLLIADKQGHLHQWMTEYQARFPAVGACMFRPPGLAIAEGCSFLLFGPQPWAGRVAVLMFAVGSVLVLYRLGAAVFDQRTAIAGTALLITTPSGVRHAGDISIAWPTCFWMGLAGLAIVRCGSTRSPRWAVVLAAAVVAGILTHPAAVLVPVSWLVWRIAWASDTMPVVPVGTKISLAVSAILVGVYAILFRRFLHLAIRSLIGTVPGSHLLDPGTYTYYPGAAIDELGMPFLAMMVIATVSLAARQGRGHSWVGVGWAMMLLALCTLAATKSSWLLIPMAAPLAIQSAGVVFSVEQYSNRKGPSFLLAGLIFLQVVLTPLQIVESYPTFRPVIDWLAGQPDAQVVLYDGPRSGQFVFDVRRHSAGGERLVPVLGETILFSDPLTSRWPMAEPADNAAILASRLRDYQVRYVVRDKMPEVHPLPKAVAGSRSVLGQAIRKPDLFEFSATFGPFSAEIDAPDEGVDVYRRRGGCCEDRTELILPLPVWGREVAVFMDASILPPDNKR